MCTPIRTLFLTAAFIAIPVAFAAPATAAPANPPASSAKPQMNVQRHSIFDELDLTDKQKDGIKSATQQNFQKLRPKMQSLMEKQQAFEKLTPGSSEYQSQLNVLASAEADFARARTLQEGALRTQIYNILTPTQRTKLQKLLAEQRARIQKMRAEQARHQHAAAPASH